MLGSGADDDELARLAVALTGDPRAAAELVGAVAVLRPRNEDDGQGRAPVDPGRILGREQRRRSARVDEQIRGQPRATVDQQGKGGLHA